MQLGCVLTMLFCIFAGLSRCLKAQEDGHSLDENENDKMPAGYENTGPSSPASDLPASPQQHDQLPAHLTGRGQGEGAGGGHLEDTVHSGHSASGSQGSDGSGNAQQQESLTAHVPGKATNPDTQRAVPGVNIEQPTVGGHSSGDGQLPHSHSELGDVKQDQGSHPAGSSDGETNQQSALPSAHQAVENELQFSKDKTPSGESNNERLPPSVSREPFPSTADTPTASATPTTESPVERPVDQIESPPTQPSPEPQHGGQPQQSVDSAATDTQTRTETSTEKLLSDAGGVLVTEEPPPSSQPSEEEEEDEELKTEDFPSFGEWRQKVLEEQEKEELENKVKAGAGGVEGEGTPAVTVNSQKLRVNYAAKVCGAKVVASNPEMENGNHMLTANRDEYMINPCSARKWFVVELCEPVMVRMVELASLELFSSHPHSFRVALSDRFPTKEWVQAGTHDMTMEKVPQTFTLKVKAPFVKFVRIEMLDHYGNEHYCPITLFRVFGVAMEDDGNEDEAVHHAEGEDEEQSEGNGEAKTLFTRTKETVVNLVKKVLYKGEEPEELPDEHVEVPLEQKTNASSNGTLPCDPNFPGDSVQKEGQEKKAADGKGGEGVEVTAHHPQPTITSMPGATVRVGQEEIPMVTKLGDGDQVEIEDDTRETRQDGDRHLVRLLQSGSAHAFGYITPICLPTCGVDPGVCNYRPLCTYVRLMSGEPLPVSLRPHPGVDVTVTSTASSVMPSASSQDLEPSFPQTVTTSLKDVETSRTVVTDFSSSTRLHPSSDDHSQDRVETSGAETYTTSADTLSVKSKLESVHTSGDSRTVASDTARQSETSFKEQSVLSTTQADSARTVSLGGAKYTDSASHTTSSTLMDRTSDLSPSEVDMSTKPHTGKLTTDSQAVETGVEDSSTPTSAIDDSATSHPAEASDTVSSDQESSTQSKETEILEPSVDVQSTTVVSPSLTRPTPVLEVDSVSDESGMSRQEVQETAMPCVSPSPTSVSSEAEQGDMSQSAYPQIVPPTIDPSHSIETTPSPGGEASSDGTTKSLPQGPPPVESPPATQEKNETEKRQEELDLVHVPLTVNAKRETAIMRLTNRIKALELNVSLSSRFLEELSTRFKKQNEELMRMLNKTVSRINATAVASQRQNQDQEVRIERLEHRVDNLTYVVQQLADRFDSFAEQMTDRQMIATSINFLLVVFAVLIWLRSCKPAPLHPDLQFLLDTMPRHPQLPSNLPRRNSEAILSGSSSHNPDWGPPALTLKKGGSVANLTLVTSGDGKGAKHPDRPLPEDQKEIGPKKKKRKKSKALKASCGDLSSGLDGNRNNAQLADVQTTVGVLFGVDSEGRALSDITAGKDVTSLSDRPSSTSSMSTDTGRQLGHRRCGSASASMFSSESETSLASEASSGVQFQIGDHFITPIVKPTYSVPVSLPVPACLNCGAVAASPLCPNPLVPGPLPLSTCCVKCGTMSTPSFFSGDVTAQHGPTPISASLFHPGEVKMLHAAAPVGPSLEVTPSESLNTAVTSKPPLPGTLSLPASIASSKILPSGPTVTTSRPAVMCLPKPAVPYRSGGLEEVGGSYIMAGASSAVASRMVRPTRSVELPRPTRVPETRAVLSHPVAGQDPAQSSYVSKAKKWVSGPLPAVNGDRGTKGTATNYHTERPTKPAMSNHQGDHVARSTMPNHHGDRVGKTTGTNHLSDRPAKGTEHHGDHTFKQTGTEHNGAKAQPHKGSLRGCGLTNEERKGPVSKNEPTKFKGGGLGGGGTHPKPWRGKSF